MKGNFVAKHMNKVNKAATHIDRKKQAKTKPKNKYRNDLRSSV